MRFLSGDICICICFVSNIYIYIYIYLYWLLTLEEQGLFLISQFIVQLETSIMTLFGKFFFRQLTIDKEWQPVWFHLLVFMGVYIILKCCLDAMK